MTATMTKSLLFIAIMVLASLPVFAQNNVNTTTQEGRVNINLTHQCGDSNDNSTYQDGRVNINRTIQRCGNNRNQTAQFGKVNHNRTEQGRGVEASQGRARQR
jgi:hypothetical protein